MPDRPLKKSEIFDLVEAQGKTTDDISQRLVKIESADISQRLVKIESLVEKQDSKNQNIVIGVVVAFILVVGTVAVEVILSNRGDAQFYSGLEKDIYEQNLRVQDLNNKVDNVKIRNPYLK